MLQGPIAVKLFWFALPIIISGFLQQLLNAADIAVVGRFADSNAMAAVGANTFVINLMLNLFVGLSVGANVVIARYIGAGETEKVKKAVHTSLLIAVLCGFFLIVAGWLVSRPMLTLLGTPPEILDNAVLYFRIYFMGMPFTLVMNFAIAILRSKGDTKRPLFILTYSGLMNVLLNLFFVTQCNMTVEGVAYATLISNGLSACILLHLLRKERSEIRFRFRHLHIDKEELIQIARIGIPAGIQGVIFNISNVLIQSGVNSLGTAAVAANTASLNYDYFCFFIGNAFGQAATSFMGQNLGALKIDRCKKIIRDCMILGPSITFFVSMFLVFYAKPLSELYTTDPEVVTLAVQRIGVVLTFYGIHSFNEILSGVLRAMGHAVTPAVINVLFICGIRLFWLFFVFPTNPTFSFLMWCYPLSWIVNITVLMGVFFWIVTRAFRAYRLQQA